MGNQIAIDKKELAAVLRTGVNAKGEDGETPLMRFASKTTWYSDKKLGPEPASITCVSYSPLAQC
jgi:hypothetical protein